ncbi:MAG: hypothetical protein ACREPZ_02680 [Rhodanobacteraceae bacterium]
MDPTLYCIASLASISVLQLLTVAAGLPLLAAMAPPDAVVAGIAAVPAIPGIPAVVAGAVVMGAAVVVAGIGLVVPGAGWFDEELLPPQAASTSEQARTGASIFTFIIRSPLPRGGLSAGNAPRRVKTDTTTDILQFGAIDASSERLPWNGTQSTVDRGWKHGRTVNSRHACGEACARRERYIFSNGQRSLVPAKLGAWQDWMQAKVQQRALRSEVFQPRKGDVF